MKILILTQFFPPEMGAPPARLFEMASRLRDRGHEVTVLTAMPNRPTGRVFEGYRGKLRMTETIEGIRVVRTWIRPSNTPKALRRLLADLSYLTSTMLWGWWGLGRQDVVLYQSPPLFATLAARWLKLFTRGKLVMWVSDIWPDLLVRIGQLSETGLAFRVLSWLERYGYKHADVVAATNPGARQQIAERFPDVTTTVFSNGVDTDFFRPGLRNEALRAELGAGPDDFLVGYVGLHGLFQGLEAVIDAADRLRDRSDIKFAMMGAGVVKEKLRAMAAEKTLENLTFHAPRPKSDMPVVLGSIDTSLVPLASPMPGTMPSKVYEALAAGTPIIVARHCEGAAFVEQFDVGAAFEPTDGAELAGAIRALADHRDRLEAMRTACVDLAKRFDRNVLADRVNDVLVALHEGRHLPEVAW
ncbi:MAG: glycosyltransferase family 4 protein [Planctomycetota bacterium]